ncbi:C45 family autoproteolytic acyltransferase/hydolase [Roseospira navarrensis]|uniref:Peptidase C45 hydrolase domain-containing protein n=1 Tax=Roseospira navarrensis TaxID=140058 RepID=A0A7X1ZAX3_9PROT|nr:C45 family peptidase [Roseospira navarrensis]MQX35204.1 hypothetical protein [Roseospira navarrensis]
MHTAGDPAAIGRALGVAGVNAFHRRIKPSRAFTACAAFVGSDRLAALEAAARTHTPAALAEVAGLAEGLALPFPEVFAWMCRGDLPGVLWPAPPDAGAEGCTTVAWRDGAGGGLLAHNEDGDPTLRDAVFLARIEPDGAPAFTAFCYPGSLPGHAFTWTDAGLVMTINNIRAGRPGLGVPRILRARAALAAHTLAEARSLLENGPIAGAYHHLLARPGEGLLGVETAAEGCACDPGPAAFAHANHALWSRPVDQVVTPSSAARQTRAETLLRTWPARPTSDHLRGVLDDRADPALPIRRTDPADPDGENILGRLVATVTAADLQIDAGLVQSP